MVRKIPPKTREADSVYILKIVLYFILGTVWIRHEARTVFPLGFFLGILIARQDRFRIDRKVEYALLLLASVMGLIGLGIFISL